MTFSAKNLVVTALLGQGTFGNSGYNRVDLSGYRTTAVISKNGIPAMNLAEITIYGLNQSLSNQLSRVGLVPTAIRNNIVTIEAGDEGGNLSLAFSGAIMDAWQDANAAPEVSFNITGATGYLQNMQPILPSSYPGPTDVATIMENLAKQMGYTLENNGVSGVMLNSPYLPGTARAQAMAAADQADIFLVFEDDQGIMAIFPKNGARSTAVPVVSAATGMVGYPSYVGPGMVQVRSLYNPALRFGGNFLLQSSVNPSPANAQWRVVQLVHRLSAQMPNGDWFSEAVGNLQLASAA